MFDCVWRLWYTLQLMYFWAPLIYLMISWFLFDAWFRHIYYPILKFGDYVDFMSINKYVCLTTPRPPPPPTFLSADFDVAQHFFSLMATKQIFSTWQTMKITLLVSNVLHRIRTFPLSFKQDFVLKGICILPSGSTFNPRCHEFETMLVWYIATTKL